MDEEPLSGGNWTEVLRVGDTIRRTPGPTSAFAARLLLHLSEHGFAFAPRYLGRDEEGRDVLDFVPGRTTDHPSQRDERSYRLAATQLRALHDLTAGRELAGEGECVIHGDCGPYNTIFRDGLPVAFIDWDAARPGSRLDDLGYFAWAWCVLGLPGVPPEVQARRMAAVGDGYGMDRDVDLLGEVTRVQRAHREGWQLLAEQSSGPAREQHLRAVAWADRDLHFIRENESTLRRTLDR